MRVRFYDTTGGLWIAPGADKAPPSSWRRFRGVRPDSEDSIRSRWGSTLLFSENAHSLYRFQDNTISGVGTTLHRDGTEVVTGLQGDRLAFAVMQNINSTEDFLFFCGDRPESTDTDPDPNHTADFTWGAFQAGVEGKIFVQDGFSSTVSDSHSVFSVDTLLKGCSYNSLGNTPASGSEANKLYLYSSNITSTIKTSTAIGAVTTFPRGTSADESGDTGLCSNSLNKVWLLSGQFSTTVHSSFAFTGGEIPKDLSFLDSDTLLGTNDNAGSRQNIKVMSGKVTSTVKVSTQEGVQDGLTFNGRDWLGTDTSGTTTQRFYKFSGLITSAIRTSASATVAISPDHISGMEHNSFSARFTTVEVLASLLQKLSKAGVASNWGIIGPTSGQAPAVADAGSGSGPNGTYEYKMTYLNTASGHRSNPSPSSGSVTVADNSINVTIASGDLSSDAQVDAIELWRTVAGGAIFFKLTNLEHEAQTYVDSTLDVDLLDEELQTDNSPPSSAFTTCVGPHAGRMWWARVQDSGQGGRVFFSPIGRPESQDGGSITLSDDDDRVEKLAVLGGNLYAFSTKWLWQIAGSSEPFVFRRVFGAPGTSKPHSVVTTPYGIVYFAQDGLRVFDGNNSVKLGYQALRPLFRGETVEDYEPFEPEFACFARDEYIMCDGVRTFAYCMTKGVYREIGLSLNGLYYDPETDEILATIMSGENETVVTLEDEGVETDNGEPISFEVETSARKPDPAHELYLSYLFFDLDTKGEYLTPSVTIDGIREDLEDSPILTLGRETVEVPLGRSGRSFSIALNGNLRNEIEVFGIEAEVDGPYGMGGRG